MKNKILIASVAFLLGISSWLLGFTPKLGGVTGGQAYNATTTNSASASATYSYVLCGAQSTLGSITVVQPASAGYVAVWNATSTATSTYQTTNLAASTLTYGNLIAKVSSASDVFGTLNFDSVAERGVVIETQVGFDGQYVVTCRR